MPITSPKPDIKTVGVGTKASTAIAPVQGMRASTTLLVALLLFTAACDSSSPSDLLFSAGPDPAVAKVLSDHANTLENLAKRDEGGDFTVPDSEVNALKMALSRPLNLSVPQMVFITHPRTGSGFLGGAVLVREREGDRFYVLGRDGVVVPGNRSWAGGLFIDSAQDERLLMIWYDYETKGDPWRAAVGTTKARLYMRAQGTGPKRPFAVTGLFTVDYSYLEDASGTVRRLGRAQFGDITDVDGRELLPLN